MDNDLPARVKYSMNEAKHDCFFLVGPEDASAEKIGAIKALLVGDSEPFRVMLGDGELAETRDIRVKDVEPETFRSFLKCIYGASNVVIPKLTFEESAKLLYVVEKYLVEVIKPEITDHVERLLSLENIFDALSHPICYHTKEIKTKILDTLKYNFDKIAKDEKFLELDGSKIIWILKQEPIFVKETEIWNAVLQWAKHNTGSGEGKVLRSCIYEFLKYIRFLTMDSGEFWEIVASTGILLEDEINYICKALTFINMSDKKHLCTRRNNRYNIYRASENVISSIMEFPCQAFIRCSVSPITQLTLGRNNRSKTYIWAGHFWCISVVKQNVNSENTSLFVVVRCHGKTPIFDCTVDIEVSLINQSGKPDKTLKWNKTFCPSHLSSGCMLYKWNERLDPDNKFLKNDSIIVLAKIQLQNT